MEIRTYNAIKAEVILRPKYKEVKKVVWERLMHYNSYVTNRSNVGEMTTWFYDFASQNLSRKEAFVLANEIVDSGEFNDAINEEMTEYLTGVEGNCSPDYVTRFTGDPDNNAKLCSYVRSLTWTQSDYFKEES